MSEQPVRITAERPPPPKYIPGKCYALKSPDDRKAHCLKEPARLYPVGWRCDPHSPAALRTSRETSPTIQKEAA